MSAVHSINQSRVILLAAFEAGFESLYPNTPSEKKTPPVWVTFSWQGQKDSNRPVYVLFAVTIRVFSLFCHNFGTIYAF